MVIGLSLLLSPQRQASHLFRHSLSCSRLSRPHPIHQSFHPNAKARRLASSIVWGNIYLAYTKVTQIVHWILSLFLESEALLSSRILFPATSRAPRPQSDILTLSSSSPKCPAASPSRTGRPAPCRTPTWCATTMTTRSPIMASPACPPAPSTRSDWG